jgi:peptidoglycan/LPS O-acetylase OafA/YrhL
VVFTAHLPGDLWPVLCGTGPPGVTLFFVLSGYLLTTLLLRGLVTTRSPRIAWLSSRPMAFLAAISYTFYLVHGFLVNGVAMIVPEEWGRPGQLLAAALALAVSIYVCWMIHRWYEEPLRTYGVHLSRRIDAARAVRPDAPALVERVAA